MLERSPGLNTCSALPAELLTCWVKHSTKRSLYRATREAVAGPGEPVLLRAPGALLGRGQLYQETGVRSADNVQNTKERTHDFLKKHLKASPEASHLRKMHFYWNAERYKLKACKNLPRNLEIQKATTG